MGLGESLYHVKKDQRLNQDLRKVLNLNSEAVSFV